MLDLCYQPCTSVMEYLSRVQLLFSAFSPFLLPYETRLLLFYVISFDRDRAMQRLQDTNETSSMAENVGRLAHRLERKKVGSFEKI